jgi:multisubunit Na+/H+ antiporter MnhB subunit
MTVLVPLDAGVAALVLGVAVWTVATRSAFAAVVGFVAFGLLVSIAWVRLAAVDVALTEVAIGAGATGMLLLIGVGRLRVATAMASAPLPPQPAVRAVAAGLSVLVAAGLAAVVLMPANPAPTLAAAVRVPMAALGVGNPVTAVLLAYRPLDTLLEGVVLLLALVGVWSLAPDCFWGGAPELRHPARSAAVLRLMAQLLTPIGIVVAVYMFWAGTSVPGGKFQAGTVLVAMWVLLMMAGLSQPPGTGSRRLRFALVVGPAVFLLVGFWGFASPGVFLGYPPGLAKPLILLIEAAMTVSIAATLGLLVAGPASRPPQP